MDFYLQCNGEEIRLPVPPKEFSISKGFTVSSLLVEQLGEIGVMGNRKLGNITLQSMFPNKVYNFCRYKDIENPYRYVDMIDAWMDSKEIIRFYITRTNVDIDCVIEEFIYGEKDGGGDVEFTLRIKEYIPAGGKRRSVKGTGGSSGENSQEGKSETSSPSGKEREESKDEKVYVVKKGDCLTFIAKREYGDSSRWNELYEKNRQTIGSDPDKIYPGQVLYL